MVCTYCKGQPDAPRKFSKRCKDCDGEGTRSVCSECYSLGITQQVLDLDKYDGQDPYEVLVHQPGENALVALDCSRYRKSGNYKEDRRICETVRNIVYNRNKVAPRPSTVLIVLVNSARAPQSPPNVIVQDL